MTSFEERMKNIRRDKELEREREREKRGYATLFSRGARRVCIVTCDGGPRNGITFSGGSLPHSKLPGCHSNWPGAEQSGLLPAICQRISRYLFPFFSLPPRARGHPRGNSFKGLFFHLKRPRYIVADSKRSRGALFSPHLLEELGGYNIIFRRVK